jgi:glycosyltransferase involved in cell wall biosynthesis
MIGHVLDTMPGFVDLIIVVDDASTDRTPLELAAGRARLGDRLVVHRHARRSGVGRAIATGYRLALEGDADVVAVMAGDGQMAPAELSAVLDPVVEGRADYAKGNRLFTGEAWRRTPKVRYLGNAFLSLLTKIASGYWHVADSQSGYTAISRAALEAIDLDAVYPRYGVPNDLLIKLNVIGARVADVPVTPLYGIGERSSMRIWRVIPTISLLLLRGFLWRLGQRYVVRDFHPLVFFYLWGALFAAAGLALGALETYLKLTTGAIALATVVLVALLIISGLHLLLFAMWLDMEYNRPLRATEPSRLVGSKPPLAQAADTPTSSAKRARE